MSERLLPQRRSPSRAARLAWQCGGSIERTFIVLNSLIAVFVVSVPVILAGLIVIFRSFPPIDLFRQQILACILTASSSRIYSQAIRAPSLSNAFFRAAIENNWFTPEETSFYRELARYRESRGARGQFPGDVTWGLVYWVIVVTLVLSSVPYATAFYPLLGGWTWLPLAILDIPLSIGCWIVYARRVRSQYFRAEKEGFPLASLYPWVGRKPHP